jgi:hypothetical protein
MTGILSKNELLARGWTNRQIGLALDKADEYGPCNHWLNPYGEPFYNAKRVAVAAHYLGIGGFPEPTDASLAFWRSAPKPTRIPILTFHFHRLAAAYIPASSYEFARLRISHPFLGRWPGTHQEEAELIEKTICVLLTHSEGIEVADWSDVKKSLHSRAEAAVNRLGSPWPNVVARPVRRTTYIAKATGPRALARALDALSLIETGRIGLPWQNQVSLQELLIDAPALRFDLLD